MLFVLIELIVLFDSRCIFNLLFVFYCEKMSEDKESVLSCGMKSNDTGTSSKSMKICSLLKER